MKLQCTCGAKYEFEVTPDMARGGPVHFVCPACGLDSSAFVTSLVRQEYGGGAAEGEALPVAQFAPAPAAKPPPPAAAKPTQGLRIHAQPAEQAPPSAEPEDGPQYCKKHPSELCEEKCYVCSKPICPKCMQLFGYLCGPLCKAKAESHGINLPVYEGQKSVIEARLWRKVCRVAAVAGVVIVAFLGVWFWYEWFGSLPKPIFSTRFEDSVRSGVSYFCGSNQIVFLHGDTLARYDMAQKKEVWSRQLLDRKRVADRAAKLYQRMQEIAARAYNEGGTEAVPKFPSLEKLTARMELAAIAALELRAQSNNVWVAEPEKLVHYDWETGKPLKEIPLYARMAGMMPRGNEFLLIETYKDKPVITHIDLSTGESRSEEIGGSAAPSVLAALKNGGGGGAGTGGRSGELAGLPGAAGKDSGKPMDPNKVAEQAQHMSLPARIALPATLSINRNQERALAEMNDQNKPQSGQPAAKPEDEGNLSLIPTKTGFVEFTEKLVELKINERTAMKPAPAKSALDGPASVANSAQMANEILNEMQRERGGDKVQEDVSSYRVTIRRPEAPAAWTGDVTGSPQLFPLDTVDVLSAGKTIIVLDKTNKKLWQSTLNYEITGEMATLDEENAMYGQGPCVEHQGALYVFDAGVLTAFDLASGNARWRLPSVGIIGMFFDGKGMIYLNTTTASPESLKYSMQIDITRKTSPIVMKIDAKTGKQLWREQFGGFINYVSGNIIYSMTSYQPEDPDDEFGAPDDRTPPYMKLRRIHPRNGTVMWEHFEPRCPLDIQFDKNTIRLVFRKEVEVLRFWAL